MCSLSSIDKISAGNDNKKKHLPLKSAFLLIRRRELDFLGETALVVGLRVVSLVVATTRKYH